MIGCRNKVKIMLGVLWGSLTVACHGVSPISLADTDTGFQNVDSDLDSNTIAENGSTDDSEMVGDSETTSDSDTSDLVEQHPIDFKIINNTGEKRYFQWESWDYLLCEFFNGDRWERCSFAPGYCGFDCENMDASLCNLLCDDYYVLVFHPGEMLIIPWDGFLRVLASLELDTDDCACTLPVNPPTGRYRATMSVWDDVDCISWENCEDFEEDGLIMMAYVGGNRTDYSVTFDVAYPDNEIVISIEK